MNWLPQIVPPGNEGAVRRANERLAGQVAVNAGWRAIRKISNKIAKYMVGEEIRETQKLSKFKSSFNSKNNFSTINNKMANVKFSKKSKVYSKRRKTNRRKKPMAKAKVDKAQNQRINAIYKSLKSDQATHTHRRRDVLQVGCNVNQVSNSLTDSTATGTLEAAMANLRYYNPSAPATLVTADASTGTYTRQVHFKSIFEKLTIRNNYQIPAMVTIWSCVPKADTNTSPSAFYSAAVTDQTISMAVTSPLLYPTDMKIVRDNWTLKRVYSGKVEPGQQRVVKHYSKSFDYDPSNVDSHALAYQKKYGAHIFYIRVEGCIAHDSIASEYTTSQAGIDTFLDRKFVMTYDAGVNLDDFSEDNNAGTTFTNAGVVSNKPVSDNQSYSQA